MSGSLLLLTRAGCGLCEEFLAELLAAYPELAPRIELADVDSRPGWQGRFGLVIPVLLDEDGTVVCETVFDPERIGPYADRVSR